MHTTVTESANQRASRFMEILLGRALLDYLNAVEQAATSALFCA